MKKPGEKEIAMLAKAGREFAAKELASDREQNDRYPFGPFWKGTLAVAAELGFFNLALAEESGGFGGAVAPLCALFSQLARTDASLAAVALSQAFCHVLLKEAGEGGLAEGMASGEEQELSGRLFAAAMFANPLETPCGVKAEKSGDGFLLFGEAPYLTLAAQAKNALVFALEGEGVSLFLADLAARRASLSPDVFSLGLHACPAADASFERAPAKRLGEPGEGGKYFAEASFRMLLPAAAILEGVIQGSFKDALGYARKREQGGRRILDWSEVRMILSGMAMRARNAETLTAASAEAADAGSPSWRERALAAFLQVADDACKATTDGIQIFGGVGYMKDYPQEKRFRDAKHLQAIFGLYPLKRLRLLTLTAGL
ncbi:MAG: acyl-CoA dehydrogenase family protein [Thermodesulfobacteriota bacterium]